MPRDFPWPYWCKAPQNPWKFAAEGFIPFSPRRGGPGKIGWRWEKFALLG
jgi:hypothetical protein